MSKHRYDSTCWRPALQNGKEVKLVLEIDRMDLLDWLGDRALHSKGGKAQVCHGAIRVRIEVKKGLK